MNWISNAVPKIRNLLQRREVKENLWVKCPETGQLVFHKDVEANQWVIPGSNYHMRMGATARLKSMFDGETWFDIAVPDVPVDPLKFRDERRYADRLKDARTKTGMNDAFKLGFGRLENLPVVIAVQDFDFMGGSLGMAAGEAVIRGLETAVEKKTPFILFAASGGARMQEGVLSLMQLPRTTVAIQHLRAVKQPYIVVLTNPTTGGVTASYAMLGDVQLAEPGALVGFAGPRVIEQTIREKLPEGFQRAEYLRDHGMVDIVVSEFELPAPGTDWKAAIRGIAISAHDVLVRHPWAASLMLSSTGASPARWRYMNTILGCLREAGLSADLTDHAYHALDSHITGFTLWQVQIQIDPEKLPDMAATFLRELPGDEYPYLVEHVHQHLKEPSPEDEGAFAFGLDLILDGLERIRDAA